jgi:hypothetical protein
MEGEKVVDPDKEKAELRRYGVDVSVAKDVGCSNDIL